MSSWERSKRLHSRNMYKRTHLSISRFGQTLIVENVVFFSPKYHKIYLKVHIWHRRTMQLLKPDQPIMVSKDEVSLWEYQFNLIYITCWYAEGEEFQVPWINWNQGLQVELARRIIRKLAHLSFLAFSSNMVTGKGALPEMSLIMMCFNSQVSSACHFLKTVEVFSSPLSDVCLCWVRRQSEVLTLGLMEF